MAMQEPQSEPSMEEILASIRRIISEDEPQPDEEVLELSRPAPAPAPQPVHEEAGGDLLIFDQEDEPEDNWRAAEPEPTPPPPRTTKAPQRASDPRLDETLMSDSKAAAAAGSFTRLAGSIRVAESQGQTLEAVVRDLLRPMLRDWLEQNLPSIVESKVEAELDRISRLSR
jgi:cell pole-organizing protein PopZ